MGVTRKLRRAGVKKPRMVRREADRARVPLHIALAMLEKETGIPQRNVFGHDAGGPFPGQKVTKERVKKLIASGHPNGVGWTQLTFLPFVLEAQRAGGAHKPRNQLRVGFAVLRRNYIAEGSWFEALRAYNGSGYAAYAYARDATDKAERWKRRLA